MSTKPSIASLAERARVGPVPRRRETLSTQLTRELGTSIARGEIKPGDKLPSEQELIALYGVSRTVVREAISSLKAKGLVATRQGLGAFVLQATPSVSVTIDAQGRESLDELLLLLDLRIALEVESAGLAAERRNEAHLSALREALDDMSQRVMAGESAIEPDRRFHAELVRATGNEYFSNLLEQLGTTAIPRSRVDLFPQDKMARTLYLQYVNVEHERIYQAILQHDSAAARQAMRLHLSNSRDRLCKALSQEA